MAVDFLDFHPLSFAGCDLVVVLLIVGSEGVPRMFSPISGVRIEVTDPEVRDIPEVGIHSFSLYQWVPLPFMVGHPCP